MSYEALSPTKRDIALHLKRTDGLTLSVLARRLGISSEAVRVQVNEMIADGWVQRQDALLRRGKAGRPPVQYALTAAGQHLFPKHYDALAQLMLRLLTDNGDPARLRAVLAEIADARIAPWREQLAGLPLEAKLQRLKDLYWSGDPFTELQRCEGGWRLTEHNCPFLNVALNQPALCSTTVNMLTRLLGVRVVREQRFQDGANRCVFRIYVDQPSRVRGFQLEPDARS